MKSPIPKKNQEKPPNQPPKGLQITWRDGLSEVVKKLQKQRGVDEVSNPEAEAESGEAEPTT